MILIMPVLVRSDFSKVGSGMLVKLEKLVEIVNLHLSISR